MSSITLKISSLVIRTLSKPIANQIKAQAREHERFRRMCVSFAQALHRIDMRLRLGLLRDTAAIEREAAKEAAEAQAKKHKHQVQTVKTEAQAAADEAASKNKDKVAEKPKPAPKPRIRPLSEAKAIDSGANFISETFLFLVGGGLIVFESWRSRRKESSRREDVSDRLAELQEAEKAARRGMVELEREILRLKGKDDKLGLKHQARILPREVWELEAKEEEEDEKKTRGWLSQVFTYLSGKKDETAEDASSSNAPSVVRNKQNGGESIKTSNPCDRPESPDHKPSSIISAAREALSSPSKPPPSSPREASPTQATK